MLTKACLGLLGACMLYDRALCATLEGAEQRSRSRAGAETWSNGENALLVVSAVQASLQDHHHLSAAAGAMAVLFRQTNTVWVAFILGAEVLRAAAPDAPRLAAAPVEQQLLRVLRAAWLVSTGRRSCHRHMSSPSQEGLSSWRSWVGAQHGQHHC